MSKGTIIRFGYFIVTIVSLAGCSNISPHDNFKEHIYGQIGKILNEIPPYQAPNEKNLISSKLLPNGNIENKYKYKGTCRYMFEIDPKTQKIIAARFEGEKTDCVINP
ncbi:hypothetical protein [Desulfospira joergensenii]|uniref:hypothetical protein n=1 Tax=Desulfospira joergensenii TaxID=53329 RepID=UPI0003B30632|nr:hypothetical protein [Desulfospira joergensenii]